MSLSASPSKPEHLVKRMQQDVCYLCGQQGHWSRFCPSKSPKPDSPLSSNTIQCRCGHGPCEVKTSLSGRDYYACPIKRGVKCNGSVKKWCNDPIDERDLQPPPFMYPVCECGAGVCRRVKGTQTHDASKYYFTCPVKQGHGSCGYRVSEDEIKLLNRKSIVPIQQSSQSDKIDKDLDKGNGLHEQIKIMRIRDCSESPSSMAVSEILDKEDAGAALDTANLKRVGFPELEVVDDHIKFTDSVSWKTVEAEAVLLLSCLSTPSRIHRRQIMFQRRIFSDDSFGSCPMGWLGRLLFFNPTHGLKFPTPKPFFCCVFPSFNPILVPKQKSIPDGTCEGNQLAISSVSQHTQLSTGCHTEISGDVVSPTKSLDGERKSIMSKAQQSHREVALLTQKRLLIDLETFDSREETSMREAAKITFAVLNILGVDYKQFSDHVLDYIDFVSSIAEIDKSMENSLTMEEHNKLYEEEKMRFARLQDEYFKTKALLEASNRHRQLLSEQVSNLKAMCNEKLNQLKFFELETLKILETHLSDLKMNILETDKKLKERVEQKEEARKQSEKKQAKQIAAKEVLEKAKLELEN